MVDLSLYLLWKCGHPCSPLFIPANVNDVGRDGAIYTYWYQRDFPLALSEEDDPRAVLPLTLSDGRELCLDKQERFNYKFLPDTGHLFLMYKHISPGYFVKAREADLRLEKYLFIYMPLLFEEASTNAETHKGSVLNLAMLMEAEMQERLAEWEGTPVAHPLGTKRIYRVEDSSQ